MLTVENLWVEVMGREVLRGIDLQIPRGETHILFGKNGSGKSTLLMSLMGFPHYQVTKGKILFQGEDITGLAVHERARRGLGLAFQRPPTIRGVKIRDILTACNPGQRPFQSTVESYGLSSFLDREVNYGFSGGELKRSELLQLLVQNPRLALLDEPESGVDLENIQIVGKMIGRLLQKECTQSDREKAGLIISHTGFILDYVAADRAYILLQGRIHCQGNPWELLKNIKQYGYERCLQCQR
jgi:Fe-S cluster assembly ATP-binding protein